MKLRDQMENLIEEMLDGRILLTEALAEFEKVYIQKALERNSEHLSQTADILGIHRNTLVQKSFRLSKKRSQTAETSCLAKAFTLKFSFHRRFYFSAEIFRREILPEQNGVFTQIQRFKIIRKNIFCLSIFGKSFQRFFPVKFADALFDSRYNTPRTRFCRTKNRFADLEFFSNGLRQMLPNRKQQYSDENDSSANLFRVFHSNHSKNFHRSA